MTVHQAPTGTSRIHTISRPGIVVNHATVREKMDFLSFVPASAHRGLSQVSIWEDEVRKVGADAARACLKEHGVSVFGFNRAGPFLAKDTSKRHQLVEDAKRSVDLAVEFEADHVLVFPGGLPDASHDMIGARQQSEDCIAELLDHARQYDIRLALEPLHPMVAGDRSCIVTLSHANDICDRLEGPLGIVIDVYHVWWDDRLDAEIERAGTSGRILGFHVNDWLVPTRHLLRDRGMMGDGIIELERIWEKVRKAGYQGPIEVEIFSDDWWGRDPDNVLNTSISRCRDIFGVGRATG